MRFNSVLFIALLAACMVLTCTVYAEAPTIEATETPKNDCTYELSNPLSKDAVQPLPYKEIKFDHYAEAFERHLIAQEFALAEIRVNQDRPSFENTIVPLATIAEGTERVLALMSTFVGVKFTKKLQALYLKLAAEHEKFVSKVRSDRNLMARVKAVEARGPLNRLTDEEKALLNWASKMFIDLPKEKIDRLDAISERLNELSSTFRNHITAETKAFALELDESQMKSIPEVPRAMAKKAAEERGRPGKYIFTLDLPSFRAFMRFCDRRDLRHKMWLAFHTRCTKGEFDNRPLIPEILALRQEEAEIRKGKGVNFATYHMEQDGRMAKTPENVYDFLNGLRDGYREPALKEITELEAIAGHKIEPWDVAYYQQILKKEKLKFNEEEYRPYLQFENVLQGAFFAAENLFGIKFVERKDVQTWHKTVRAYEVFDRAGQSLGFYYIDPFPRKGKKTGAWMTTLIDGGQYRRELQRPHVVNVGNMSPPVKGTLSLLSLDDVRTIFHEMGHALHALLSKARYNALFGTNVTWDFVELPSQLLEKWRFQPDVVLKYARHYKTDEPIPQEMIDKIEAAGKVGEALFGIEKVFKARLDMDYHTKPLNGKSIEEFEAEVRQDTLVLPEPGALWSGSFQHVFAGSYAAGFYVYDWGDNLVADAMTPFEENGMFDPMTSGLLHSQIFEMGSTAPAEIIYPRFRGQDPDPQAMLKRQGYLPRGE